MPIPSKIGEYIIVSLAIILAPGPSVLFTIARAIAWGRKVAVLTVLGNATGFFAMSLLVALGIGPIIQSSDLIYAGVQWAGGLYLIYLGVDAIRKRNEHSNQMLEEGSSGAPSAIRIIRDGFVVGILNPKGIVFNAAVTPQFIDRGSGNVVMQLILLGAIFALLAFFCDGTWGLLAGTARNWLATNLSRIIFLRIVGGIVMIILGVLILIQI
ncbi:MAG: LysE family translocator [Actinobacteria bacterium]|nr:LysE family translocator [Actinomycetota bacterium]